MKTYLPPRCRQAVCVPRGEARPRDVLHLLVERVEVVLELGDEYRLLRPPAPLAVPDVEDDQPVVPVARVHQAVDDVEVVHVARGVGAVGVPLAGADRMRGVGEVDDVDGAGAVVGDEDVAAVLRVLVDVDRVHARGDAVGELRDLLRVQRIAGVGDDDAVLPVGGSLAGEDHDVAVGGGLHVVHEAGVRHDRIDHHRLAGVGDVDGVHPVAAHVGAEVGHLAVGMDPDLARGEGGDREPADDGDRPPDVALLHRDRGAGRAPAERGGDGVDAGAVGDEAAVGIELAVARSEAPGGSEPRHRMAGAVPPLGAEGDHVALAHRRLRRPDRELRDPRARHHPHVERRRRAADRRGERRAAGGEAGDRAVTVHRDDLGPARLPAHGVERAVVGLGVGKGADPERLAVDDRRTRRGKLHADRRARHDIELRGRRVDEGPASRHGRAQGERELADRARHQPAARRIERSLALAAAQLDVEHGVGQRRAAGIQRPDHEPHRVAGRDGAGRGLDLDARHRSRRKLALGLLLRHEEQGGEQTGEKHGGASKWEKRRVADSGGGPILGRGDRRGKLRRGRGAGHLWDAPRPPCRLAERSRVRLSRRAWT